MSEEQFKIVGLGEVLFDVLPTGKQSGGAPANFAYVSSQLGNQGIVASRVGSDEDGRGILKGLKSKSVDVSHIQTDAKHQTGTVKVSLENGQPGYEITANVAWDFIELTEDWRDLAANCDAVCFGTLAQRNSISRKTIQDFVNLTRHDCLRIFDVNLRQNYYSVEILHESLESANVVKLNNDELPKICELFEIKRADEKQSAKNLREKFDLRLICLTRGANGSLLLTENEFNENSGVEIKIADTIGAGDAFTAALTHGFLRRWSLDEINVFANKVGAFVASQTGAMPGFPKNF